MPLLLRLEGLLYFPQPDQIRSDQIQIYKRLPASRFGHEVGSDFAVL